MDRTTEVIYINSAEQISAPEVIKAIPRERSLKIVFSKEIENERETIGERLKKQLVDFQIGIHTVDPAISIEKLITDKEIEDNQDFFEQCAKDYRQLGEELIFKLVEKLKLILDPDFPMKTFNKFKQGKRQMGKVENWSYFVHGFHCEFVNLKTGQEIEVHLLFGLEFGDLDPYFFSKFIKSTPAYQPLPVEIYENFADGVRIIDKMTELGKFEIINSNVANQFGIAVTDRKKTEIKSQLDLHKLYTDDNKDSGKPTVKVWKFKGKKK